MPDSVFGIVGLKSLMWSSSDMCFVSPSRPSFQWKESVVWAKSACQEPLPRFDPGQEVDNTKCMIDPDDHIIVGSRCRCGIYATLDKAELYEYEKDFRCVAFLVEALGYFGNSMMHEYGFRAAGIQVIKVVDTAPFRTSLWTMNEDQVKLFSSAQEIAIEAALHTFHLTRDDVIPLSLAVEIMKIMWNRNGGVWPVEYLNYER